MATCSQCDEEWSGLAMAHCFACHMTFTSVNNFDKHRTGYIDHRRCVAPESLGMQKNSYGNYRFPMDDDVAERLHGGRQRLGRPIESNG